ncbi:uncharacterized protein LOC127362701 [Dicentrarchus labrax]|uniref:uncharacterized protein LOC127362701 n=1 Tax=Dicentrarchus labrax TaxID=13489 RepID=UPI0021F65A00|nr:uncharacterized protein LOC127362701 [Dicentrarchus labrax]
MMLTMDGDMLIFLLALCFMCVSSDDDCFENRESCETQTLSAPLGSSVLLHCEFTTNNSNWVSWIHNDSHLVRLKSNGIIKFIDPRHGRVKAFPNHASKGNHSISIDELTDTDLGCYRCVEHNNCFQVELIERVLQSNNLLPLVYSCVGVAALILLTAGGYFCIKCILCCIHRPQDNTTNLVNAGNDGASAPPVEVNVQQRGEDNLVYENDDQGPVNQQGTRNQCSLPGVLPEQSTSGVYPNLNQFNVERVESQRRRLRFHTELFSRLRQSSLSRHYYVNRNELSKQQAMPAPGKNQHRGLGKKKVNENCEYKNPIYNRSTDQLDRP